MSKYNFFNNCFSVRKILSLASAVALIGFSGKVIAQTAHSLSLKESIQYGLSHHTSVSIYNNNVRKSQQLARQSLADYLPQVSVNAGIDDNLKLPQTIIPAGTFGPGTPERKVAFGSQYSTSMTAQVDQKIYDQSLLTGLKALPYNIDLASTQKEQNSQVLIYNIASAYFQIIVAQKQLELLENNKTQFEKILKVTKLQADQGVIKKVDIKQVQVNLNNVIAQISVIENNLTLAKNTLKNNVGISQKDSIQLSDTARWLDTAPKPEFKSTFDYTQNLDYKLQNIQIALYEINSKMIKNKAIPSLSLYARYGANGNGQDLGTSFNPLLAFSTVGIKVSWNIFTGFRRDAQYKQAVIDVENARLNLKLNEENQDLYFQNATAQKKRTQISINTNKDNMELASEVYDNTTLQYQQGLASLSDLLNAELSYRDAQNNYINSLLDYYLADLDVQKANGTLEDYYNKL